MGIFEIPTNLTFVKLEKNYLAHFFSVLENELIY